MPYPFEDLSGKRFGMLVAERRIGGLRNIWICKCDCGNTKHTRANFLKTGAALHCGCRTSKNISEGRTRHGMINTRQYACWKNMRRRCTNPKSKQWHSYGGRGITVCDRWLNSFENFWEDMREGYADNLTIERKDNNGNYCKENCVWITNKEQHQNKRTNHLLTVRGRTQNVHQWASEMKISPPTIFGRLRRGWSAEDAVLLPVGCHGSKYLSYKNLNEYPGP